MDFLTYKNIFNENIKLGAVRWSYFLPKCLTELFMPCISKRTRLTDESMDIHFCTPNWSGQDPFFRKNCHGIYLSHCNKESYFETPIAVVQLMEITQRANCLNSLPGMNLLFTAQLGETVKEGLGRGKFVPGMNSNIVFYISLLFFQNAYNFLLFLFFFFTNNVYLYALSKIHKKPVMYFVKNNTFYNSLTKMNFLVNK